MTCSAVPRSTEVPRRPNFAWEASRKINFPRSFRLRIVSALLFAGALALAPQPAGAQHGGGHSGGGGHSSGGHASASNGSSSSHETSSSSKAATNSAVGKPASSSASMATNSSAASASGSGLIHSGSPLPIGSGSSPASAASFAAPRAVTIGFPPMTEAESVRMPIVHQSHLSFFGDGNEIWQEPSSSQAIHSQATHSVASQQPAHSLNRAVAPAGTPPAPAPSVALKVATPVSGARLLDHGIKPQFGRPIVSAPVRRHPRVSPIFPGFGFFGFGGPFFGFGWGLNGWTSCDPTWSFDCGGYGDFYPGYDADASAGSYPPDQETGTQAVDDSVRNEWLEAPVPPGEITDEIASEKSLVVIYLNDGSVYALTNYWVEGGKLHYKTSYGGENSLDLNQLDIQRTVNANAARGVDFTLRPGPAAGAAAAPPEELPPTPESVPQKPAKPEQQPN
jgi:hypothetical protein